MEFMTNLVVLAAAMLEAGAEHPSGGSVGLSVSYALQVKMITITC